MNIDTKTMSGSLKWAVAVALAALLAVTLAACDTEPSPTGDADT